MVLPMCELLRLGIQIMGRGNNYALGKIVVVCVLPSG